GDAPETVAQTIAMAIDAGMVGGGIEDHTGDRDQPLYDLELGAERIAAAPRTVPGGYTAIGAALEFATAKLAEAPFAAARRVIDISGDGRNNRGPLPEDGRQAAAHNSNQVIHRVGGLRFSYCP
ncbi:MAG: DUF1194 domain-containing protein, partial [Actinomycetota bacterium]